MQELEKTPSMQLNTKSLNASEANMTLGPLSKDLATHLLSLSKQVVAKEITPKTVNAACQCASELYKIMKLNWEMRNK